MYPPDSKPTNNLKLAMMRIIDTLVLPFTYCLFIVCYFCLGLYTFYWPGGKQDTEEHSCLYVEGF